MIREKIITDKKQEYTWEVPSRYYRNRFVLEAQAPNVLYGYWEVSDGKQQMVEHHFRTKWPQLEKVLRVYDITAITFNGHNAHRSYDIVIPEMTDNWFFHNLDSNCTYCVDFGTKTYEGSFFTILRSNPIDTPRVDQQQCGIHSSAVSKWRQGVQSEPDWLEHFSTYSYYQKLK
ncbi:DUF4912 domain-containing protein [Desertibacillus haloalkaliphilus]|uniref:DUF4912 domain-containing protein n=1 Tax=Desertibacillus haloalkaliphilus TaxID=1328930 RepID=UPI001C265FAF|nr:DUF4912 domain-containing protein [Desertibacillus haloalkaliphilus]